MATGNKSAAKSPRVKRGRIEIDIEKCRVDGNWSRATELVQQVSDKSSILTLSALILGESKLERWDLSRGADPSIGKEDLTDCESQLKIAAGAKDENMRAEGGLLLAKLHFLRGEYRLASDLIDPRCLERLSFESPVSRLFKIVAEAFAIKGLCLEKLQPELVHHADNPICTFLEVAGDMCLVHLQALDSQRPNASSTSGTSGSVSTPVPSAGTIGTPVAVHVGPATAPLPSASSNGVSPGPLAAVRAQGQCVARSVETAIYRSPIIHMLRGDVNSAVSRFRSLIRALETSFSRSVRQKLTRQLAEVLLRGVCHSSYQRFVVDAERALAGTANGSPQALLTQTAARIRRYDLSTGDRFVPEDHVQEAVLLLLVSEFMASQDAILNRGSDLKDARVDTLHTTAAVYDLLAIALARKGSYEFLSKTLEHALKFSYNEFHIWFQFALALINAKKFYRALLVLKECLRIDPSHHMAHVLAARLCFHHLHLVREGLELAERAVENFGGSSTAVRARSHLILGWGYGLRARESKLLENKRRDERLALEQFQEAVRLDPRDYQSRYLLALQLAQMRRIGEALTSCHRALALHHTHVHSLHLCVLLHTARRPTGYAQAERLLQVALTHHPNNVGLLLTQSRLAAALHGPSAALRVYRRMLEVWRDHYAPDYDAATGFLEKLRHQVAQFDELCCSASLDRDTTAGSARAESIAASRMEHTLSDIASSAGRDPETKLNLNESSYLRIQILLNLAELYLEMGRLQETRSCLDDATLISKLNHQVLHMKGRLHEARREFRDARKAFETAVAINPSHVKSQQRLGKILHLFGEGQLSEKVLRDALSNDPTSSRTWQLLGEVLNSMGQEETASQCLGVAAELECSEPLESFHVLSRNVY